MASLTDYTYAQIKAAVLSFISKNDTGTYVGENHVLAIEADNDGYVAAYRIGVHNWKFNFTRAEVKFSRGLTNTPWKY